MSRRAFYSRKEGQAACLPRAVITAMRPAGWLPPLFGAVLGLADAGFSAPLPIALVLLAFGPLLSGAAYVVNFMADASDDRSNEVRKDIVMSRQPFATGLLTVRQGATLAITLALLGVGCLVAINCRVAVAGGSVALLAAIYSLPPRLKRIAGLDVASNAAMIALCYVGGREALEVSSWVAVLPALWVFFLTASTYLLTEIVDREADKKVGVDTTAVVLGAASTALLAWSLYIISLALFAGAFVIDFHPTRLIVAPGLALGMWGFTRLLRDRASSERSRRLALMATIAAGAAIVLVATIYCLLSLLRLQRWF
jgi:4-hydroxybenzoate polyprenyltransferase